MKMNIYDFNLQDITNYLNGLGEPAFRVKQVWQGLYKNLWSDFSRFTVLPPSLIRKLIDTFEIQALTPSRLLRSKDGQTIKTLFKLQDDNYIETVLMSYDKRKTLCISTQVGCAMGCVFCATGQMGFKRNLTSGEIIGQVLHYAHSLKEQNDCLSNVVLMGMGEPFHNYAHTLDAVDRLNDNSGFNFGARRFTISTVGLVPEILRFAAEKRQVNLAISLHAAEDELRSSMLPINRKYPREDILSACRDYVNITGEEFRLNGP
jgi:23S rRNA (adenine2503-C2)-methyltransferase